MKKLIFFLSILLLTSCSPGMYINGAVMRNHNLSQNRNTPRNPYVGQPHKPRVYSSWGRFWFFRR